MIKNKPLVSIVIPVKEINDYIYENVEHSLKMNYDNFEIIILPDNASNAKFKKTKIIPSGNVKPGEKRNLGVKHAKGEIIAFIDDDAYPRKDWLTNAVKMFEDKSISAIGGPGVTPSKDTISQKISGAIYEYGSLNYNYRYVPGKKQEIDDFPSCNLLIRKKDFLLIKGFDENYWPGEDTKLCQDLVDNGGKIVYTPNVLVYHHRRKMIKPHLKQAFNYGFYRALFVKKFGGNSLKLTYFLPTILLIYLLFGIIVSAFSSYFGNFFLKTLSIYGGYLLITSRKIRDLRIFFGYILGSIITHIAYGAGFIGGLFKLK